VIQCGFRLPAEQVLWQAGIADCGVKSSSQVKSKPRKFRIPDFEIER
jgi:hypothetical protein